MIEKMKKWPLFVIMDSIRVSHNILMSFLQLTKLTEGQNIEMQDSKDLHIEFFLNK